MYRLVAILILLGITFPALSKTDNSAPATYILQVTSNLGCSNLNIELTSNEGKGYLLRYETGAFAAVELPSGSYQFGEVTCNTGDNQETFDVLVDKMSSISLTSGQAYYGGRLIIEQIKTIDTGDAPRVLGDCNRNMSRARGEPTNDCRDGIGVDTDAPITRQVNLYLPEITDEDLNVVRTAFSASEEQLLYLPLKAS